MGEIMVIYTKEGKTTLYFDATLPLEYKNFKTNSSMFYYKSLDG